MRAFVTGGTGFLGTHLVTALVARGDEVTCLVRSPAKAALRGWSGVRLVRGDLDNAAALQDGCAGADVIYHLAGLIAARNLDEFMRANRDGTARVMDAVPQTLRRFVLVSSIAAAGPTLPGVVIDETRPPNPVTPYGKSKLAGEVLLQNASFPWTVVRPPVVYGEWDEALLRLFKLARGGIVPLFGDGSQELSVIYGADVADALIAAATSERTAGRIYFATHPAITTARKLAEAVGHAVGKTLRFVPLPIPVARAAMWTIGSLARLVGRASVVSSERAAEFLAPAWTCRADALRADTGWQARVDLTTGLGRTAAWYRREGWLA